MSARPKAVFVLGAESSGTRLMTRCLMEAGLRGSWGHVQPFDMGMPSLVSFVLRRSYPHGSEWPDVGVLAASARSKGCEPLGVVMVRDWMPMLASQAEVHCRGDVGKALARTRKAYGMVFSGLVAAGVPYWVVTYEGLVARPDEVLSWLYGELGLEALGARGWEVRDGDARRWAGRAKPC